MPKISVILPNYNHAPYLEQRIESILNQTYQDFELILLDDCSTDNSLEVLKKYAKHPKVSHCVVNEHNSGSTFKQWDKGINLAVGEWIWIAESDDWAEKEFLETLITNINHSDKVVLSYCQSKRINSEGIATGDWKNWTDDLSKSQFEKPFELKGFDYIAQYLKHRNTIPNASAVIFRKDAYIKVGGVDMDIKYVADWLLWLKLLLVGDIVFAPENYNNFRYHDKSVIAQASITHGYQFLYKYDIILRKRYLSHCKKNKFIYSNFKSKLAIECRLEARFLKSNNRKREALRYWIDVLKYDKDKIRVIYHIIFRVMLNLKKSK